MADKITNLNLQIPNRDKIIYTSDNRAIGSMSSAKNVDNTNSTYYILYPFKAFCQYLIPEYLFQFIFNYNHSFFSFFLIRNIFPV